MTVNRFGVLGLLCAGLLAGAPLRGATDTPSTTPSSTLSPTITPTPDYSPTALPTATSTPFGPGVMDSAVITNGSVYALAELNGTLFLGGTFSQVGPRTGGGVQVDDSVGLPSAGFPVVAGAVRCVIPDGSGGWYIGGDFTYVAGQARTRLAHILSNGSLDPLFAATADNSVYCMALVNNRLYIGGNFYYVDGATEPKLSAVDPVTGALAGWYPGVNNVVYALTPDSNNHLYAAGAFTTIGGQSISYAACLDGTTGQALPTYNPAPNNAVNAVVLSPDGGTVYLGGSFTQVGGQLRGYIASTDTSGNVLPWAPNADSTVNSLAIDPSGNPIYVAGAFSLIGSQVRERIAAVDTTSQLATSWNPNANNTVGSIFLSGSSLYACGSFTIIGGALRQSIAALNTTDGVGAAWSWAPQTDGGQAYCAAAVAGAVYIGGAFNSVGGQLRNNLAAINESTGQVTAWNPGADSTVYALTVSAGTLYAGGTFANVGGLPRARLAAVDPVSGTVSAWAPNPNYTVYALAAPMTETVLVGGGFGSIGGASQSYLAAVDVNSGLATSWNPAVNGYVYALASSGNTLYVGGGFSGVGGGSRNNLGAVDLTTGLASGWAPNPGSTVYALAVGGGRVYAGGSFGTIGEQSYSYLAALDPVTGLALPGFVGGADNQVNALSLLNGALFVGGYFQNLGGQPRARLGALDPASGAALPWIANTDAAVEAVLASTAASNVYAGGVFATVQNLPAVGFDAFAAPAATPTQTASSTFSATPFDTSTPSFTITPTYSISNTPTQNATPTVTPQGPGAPVNFPVANGTVYALTESAGVLYLGGTFTRVGPETGSGMALSPSTGAALAGWPEVAGGAVRAVAGDGAGGWFIGGDFAFVAGQARARLAHLLANGSLDPNFNPAPDSTVYALAYANGILYLGGNFYYGATLPTYQTSPHLAALSVGTGSLAWGNPSVNNTVYSLALGNGALYLGGTFTSAGGSGRAQAAAMDPLAGSLLPWTPNPNSTVYALAAVSGTVYLGGDFTSVGGQIRGYAAQVDAGGNVLGFNPGANADVYTLAPMGGQVILGGAFTTLNGGTAEGYLGIVDGVSGTANAGFNAAANAAVSSVATDGVNVYAAGAFSSIGGAPHASLAELNGATGAALGFSADADAGANAIGVNGSEVFAGGAFNSLGGVARSNAAAVNEATGQVTAWNPSADNTVYALAVNPASGSVYLGGTFLNMSGQARSRLAAVDPVSGTVAVWSPNPNYTVYALAVPTSATVVVGGGFGSIGGISRSYLAAVDATTGLGTSWNPAANGYIYALANSGNTLYVGGGYSSLGGVSRTNVGAVDLTTGLATGWAPNASSTVYALALGMGNVYVGGSFGSVGGKTATYLQAVSALTGVGLPSWTCQPDNQVNALSLVNGTLYVGGYFQNVAGQPRLRVAAVDPGLGTLLGWTQNANNTVEAVLGSASGTNVYAGGLFGEIANLPAVGLGDTVPPAPTFTPTATATSTATPQQSPTATPTPILFSYTPTPTATPSTPPTPLPTATVTPQGPGVPVTFPVANGTIEAMAEYGGTLYLGGTFTRMGPETGSGVALNPATGAVLGAWPEVAGGAVRAVAGDGAGGWFIGGDFTFVAGQARARLAHIFGNGSLDPAFNPAPDNTVYALAYANGILYLGGNFYYGATLPTYQTSPHLAAISVGTGSLAWGNPSVNNSVYALTLGNGSLYLGGNFTSVGGAGRAQAAAVDPLAGGVLPWNPYPNGTVYSIAVGAGAIYLGGDFTSVGGQIRDFAAAVDAAGNVLGFNPAANADVYGVALMGNKVILGGAFTTLNGGAAENYIALVDGVSGTANAGFNANANAAVSKVATDGVNVYAAGAFTGIGGASHASIAALNGVTGASLGFSADADAGANVIAYGSGVVYAGGAFNSVGGVARSNAAAVNEATGQVTAWNPSADNTVYALAVNPTGSSVYLGGTFLNMSGQARSRLAAVDPVGGALAAWTPNANYTVYAIDAVSPSTVVVGGGFGSIGGASRSYLAAVDASSGLATAWNPAANGYVYALTSSGNTLYVGGGYSSLGGASRANAGAVDLTTGLATSWAPNPSSTVYALALGLGNVYLGGAFGQVGGQTRDYLASVDMALGLPLGWAPNPDNQVNAVAVDGNIVYAAGYFQNIAGQPRARIAAIDGVIANVLGWTPSFNSTINAIWVNFSRVYAGGAFSIFANLPAPGAAALNAPPQSTATVTPSFTISPTFSISPTASPSPTITPDYSPTQTPSYSASPTTSPSFTVSPTASMTASVSPTPGPVGTPGCSAGGQYQDQNSDAFWNDLVYFTPLSATPGAMVHAISIEVGGVGGYSTSQSGILQAGLYADDGQGQPGQLLGASDSVPFANNDAWISMAIGGSGGVAVPASGVVWLAFTATVPEYILQCGASGSADYQVIDFAGGALPGQVGAAAVDEGSGFTALAVDLDTCALAPTPTPSTSCGSGLVPSQSLPVLAGFGGSFPLGSAALTAQGNVFFALAVSGTGASDVQQMDADGNYMGGFTVASGTVIGQIAAVQGTLYVTGVNNNTVQMYDTLGDPINLGAFNNGSVGPAAPLDGPDGITTDGSFIYVANTGTNQVLQFDLNGDYISAWDSDAGDHLALLAYSNGTVYGLDTAGNQVEAFPAPGGGGDYAWSGLPAGSTGLAADAQYVYVAAGGLVTQYNDNASPVTVEALGVITPTAAAVCIGTQPGAGDLWTGSANGTVQAFAACGGPAGAPVATPTPACGQVAAYVEPGLEVQKHDNVGFGGPVLAPGDGSAFFFSTPGAPGTAIVTHYGPAGVLLSTSAYAWDGAAAFGKGVMVGNYLFAPDQGGPAPIAVLNPLTGALPSAAGAFSDYPASDVLWSLATDGTTLFADDASADTVHQWQVTVSGDSGSVGTTPLNQWSLANTDTPGSLAWASGYLFVVDLGIDGDVDMYTDQGAYVGSWTLPGSPALQSVTADNQFVYVLDASGILYQYDYTVGGSPALVQANSFEWGQQAVALPGSPVLWLSDSQGEGFVMAVCGPAQPVGAPTPELSPSPSATASASPSATASPSVSGSPSATANATAAFSPTQSQTATPTQSVTVTPSRTLSFTASPSASSTPSLTPTGSPGGTATVTSTDTVSATFTASFTMTLSLTSSPTWSYSPTVTATPTQTQSFTPSPTRTDTPSPTFTPCYQAVLAGTGVSGTAGTGIPGPLAQLEGPVALAWGPASQGQASLYIADASAGTVRVVDPTGAINPVPGAGSLNGPEGLVVDASGTLYVADTSGNQVLRIDAGGNSTVVAGSLSGSAGFGGDGGPAASAYLHAPTALALDGLGNLYIADSGNSRVRMVSVSGGAATIVSVAGSGTPTAGVLDGAALNVNLAPQGLAAGPAGDLYISDSVNNLLWHVSPAGRATAIAGNGSAGVTADGQAGAGSPLSQPAGVALDALGTVYFTENQAVPRVRSLRNGVLGTDSLFTAALAGLAVGPAGLAVAAPGQHQAVLLGACAPSYVAPPVPLCALSQLEAFQSKLGAHGAPATFRPLAWATVLAPNPARVGGSLCLVLPVEAQQGSLALYSLDGRVLGSWAVRGAQACVPAPSSPGIYFVGYQIVDADNARHADVRKVAVLP